MKSLDDITAFQLDVFKEIATIGAGNAATALAAMLNTRLDMRVPDVRIVPFCEVAGLMNGPENIIVGIMVTMSMDIQGYIMLALEVRRAREMIALLLQEPFDPEAFDPTNYEFDEMETSALQEIGNILIGSYLSAIAGLTNLSIGATIPQMVVDMAGAILSVPAITYGEIGDGVLFMETEFIDTEHKMNGQFFLIPDLNSYSILMKSLGVEE